MSRTVTCPLSILVSRGERRVNNYERIQMSIDLMEEHLREPVSLEEIAGVTCFSLPHFYRLFNALVGRTIKDYLRLRRLSEAAGEVALSGRPLMDIALDYQFSSQESFSRAFREAWGMNPGQVRKSGQHPELFPRVDLLAEYLDGEDGHYLDPSIKVVRFLGPFKVAYYRAYGEDPRRDAWDTLLNWAGGHGLLVVESPVRLFGFHNPGPTQGAREYGYEAWITVGEAVLSDGPVRTKEFTGGTYAVTRASLPTVGLAWRTMYAWLKLSRYALGPHQWLEEHLSPPGSPATEMEVDLYLPLLDRTKRGGIVMNGCGNNHWVQSIEVEKLGSMRVAYYRAMGTEPEEQAFKVMTDWAKQGGFLTRPGTRVFGFNNPNPSPGQAVYGYEVWITVPDDARGSGDVKVKDVPGGLYAAGSTAPMFHGHEIPLAWQEVGAWMRANKKVMGKHQWLEEHLNLEEDGATGFDKGLRMKLYCPLAE